MQKAWTKILLVINVESLQERSNQLNIKKPYQLSSCLQCNLCKPEEGWYGQPKYCYEKTVHVVLISFAVVFGLLLVSSVLCYRVPRCWFLLAFSICVMFFCYFILFDALRNRLLPSFVSSLGQAIVVCSV